MDTTALWAFLPVGYLLTVLIETPVLAVGLSSSHSWRRRLFAGAWLTACTYPVVILALPQIIPVDTQRYLYIFVAETLAPLAECALFALAFYWRNSLSFPARLCDFATITLANLLSFALGELFL